MPYKWRFAGGPMMARFKWYFDHLSSHQLKNSKNVVKVGPPLTKVFRPTHDWDVKSINSNNRGPQLLSASVLDL